MDERQRLAGALAPQAELRAYQPTLRDRIASFFVGDERASPEKARLVEGLLGSRGLGNTGMGLVDLTPAGAPLWTQEYKRAETPTDAIFAAANFIPGAKVAKGAAKNIMDVWEQIKHLDAGLTGDHARAMDEWVGGSHDAMTSGIAGGLMMPERLESMSPDAWAEVAAPVRQALRDHFGETIPAYRGEAHGAGQSTGRQNRFMSYTTDRSVAERFAGAGPEYPITGGDEVAAAEKALESTGEAKVGRHTFRREPDGSISIYDRNDNFVTDADDIRSVIDSDNAYAAEKNAERAKALAGVLEYSVPVDDVLWATDRFGQKEIIAPPRK